MHTRNLLNTRDPSYLPECIRATSDRSCLLECMRATSRIYAIPPTYSRIHAVIVPTMAPTLSELLAKFQPIKEVIFEPMQSEEPHQPARALLPAYFSMNSNPIDYFLLFFTHTLFQLITKHTNQYAAIQRMEAKEGQREWYNLVVEELYVFIGSIIYMGIHEEPEISMYWNTDPEKGPLHTIKEHISLTRLQQIKRYCHISDSESDKQARFDQPSNKKWWYKLEPLASSLQASFQLYYSPSSEVSIDEIMVRCFGRYITLLLYP
jgi:L-rhamnose mutarotase